MNPSEERAVWQEIKRLREQLDYASERHTAALANIRERISGLEAKLSPPTTDAVEPPPLPKLVIPAPRPAADRPVIRTVGPAVTKPVEAPVPPPEPPPEPDPDGEPEMQPVDDRSFELDFGRVWFVRIGIVILLTGLVFLGNYAYQNWIREMPNGLRLTALFACALGLVETGRRLAARDNLSRFGEVLLAGGMAFFYYCTFAAHHVGRLKVIDSPVLAAVLLFGAAGAIAAVSWLRQARATAVLGIVLASYSTMLQPIGWMSCVSSILLGAMGLFLMLKPGWSGPGWVSMLGSYGAFFGWQVLGATGKTIRTDDPASLWFLPPLWAMFAIPGVFGRFRESLSDRARAWFTGANNALFFLLYSGIWISRNGDENYWMAAAAFGSVLIALGILGRRQSTTAGGVNIAQGLTVATFALVLRLDGHHLALVLAFESLTLAMASWKFRGKSEAVFSSLAGLGAAYLIGEKALGQPAADAIPVWSGFLAAALIAAASFTMTKIRVAGEFFAHFQRYSSSLLFIAATLVASHLCLHRIGQFPALVTALFLTVALASVALRLDPKRVWPELMWAALWFLGIASWVGFEGKSALQLTLAIECLALAAVSWKFRSRTESVFSLAAGLVAAALALIAGIPAISNPSVWQAGLSAGLIAATSVLTVRIRLKDEKFMRFTRVSSAFLFIAATAVASQLCLAIPSGPAALLTAMGLSGLLSYGFLALDRKRLQPEIAWAALWFLCISGWLGANGDPAWPVWIAAAVSLAACRLWHRQPEPESKDFSPDLAAYPAVPAWAYSLAIPLFAVFAMEGSGLNESQMPNIRAAAAFVIAALAISFRCKRLLAAAAAMGAVVVFASTDMPVDGKPPLFPLALITLVSAILIHLPWSRERVDPKYRTASSWIFRAAAFTAYCAAWYRYSPGNWSDWLALTSIALTLAVLFLKRKLPAESVALAGVSVFALAAATANSPWELSPGETGWRGISVVIALLSLVLTYRQRPALIGDPEIRARTISGIAGLTCAVTTIWATQMLVWRFGWKPSAVLWTVLGFAFVSAGLWQRLHILRICGFALLVISFSKLFAVDVWDFTAFMRVASFIVLGMALILLGLFYNKFADVIKALLDDERSNALSALGDKTRQEKQHEDKIV